MAVTALPSSEAAAMSPGLPAMNGPVGPALLSFARCFGARDSHEVYMSAPITTGEAYVTWRHNNGSGITRDHPQYESLHYENVISANVTRVGSLVAKLRRRYADRLVIDPTSLDNVDGWSQSDYHNFWCALIEKYVALIVFADGWQFSTGCVYEFATALRSGKESVTESLRPLDRQDGLHMIATAIAEFERLNVDAESLRRAFQAVEQATKGG